MKTVKNKAASVRARLLNQAKAGNADVNWLMTRYGLERLLYRLGASEWHGQFLLKGALLFDLWFDHPMRPTTDIDLLGFGSPELEHLRQVFQSVCAMACEDGILFDPDSVRVAEIRKESNYAGVRVTLTGSLDGARCPVQVDIGFGDAVTPPPELVPFPVLLTDMPAPLLRVYPMYTVVAEKYHAIVSLGMSNTRMKDYFDLWVLGQQAHLDRAILAQAIRSTFERRVTRVPTFMPLGLSDDFAYDAVKQQQWKAFRSKNRLLAPELHEIVDVLRALLVDGSNN